MDHNSYSDEYLRDVLAGEGLIALVGLSSNHERDSHRVFLDLLRRGYRVVGINPGIAGQNISGAQVYAQLADAPAPSLTKRWRRQSCRARSGSNWASAITRPPRGLNRAA